MGPKGVPDTKTNRPTDHQSQHQFNTYIRILVLFQDGKLALLGCNSCFMSVAPNDDSLVAISRTVGSDEIVQIRSHAVREVRPGSNLPEEEHGSLAQIEVNYV
jgi:hypothetical protein